MVDPGLPSEVAAALAVDRLPRLLHQHVASGTWRVEVEARTLPLDENGVLPLLRLAGDRTEDNTDLLVYLTDLPRGSVVRPVLADISTRRRAALVSLPATGSFRLRRHLGQALLHVAYRLHHGHGRNVARSGAGKEGEAEVPRPQRLRRAPATWGWPLKEVFSGEEGIDTSLVLTGWRGRTRLLCGMVRTNRPWRLVPHLASATAAAAATAAFGIFYSSIWQMADALSVARLVLITVLSLAGMVSWLLFYNHLWDSPHGHRAPQDTVLYNASTLITLALGVGCMYLLLYALTLLAGLVVIDAGFLQSKLGHPAGLGDYATLAWLACSMGTVAGALGSSLDSETAVRQATYSRREQERQARNQAEARAEETHALTHGATKDDDP
ncbi:DUF2267 domain-containing protein [Streptomyces reniochalinae]|uniref:DUF2267 domain-containing protein n=2 Tax=Streptomyces reniochalinae TaxID=2250578 RepID=A0A367EA41_9ACTN|nr:DUF2267 domain-containing protein [Streptomyces reniochalinae]